MPQEIRVVRCCECGMFQCDIVKKVAKWQCKVCNTKQSLQKVYHLGSGKACRQITGELNQCRFDQQGEPSTKKESNEKDVEETVHVKCESNEEGNKWEIFVQEESDDPCSVYELKHDGQFVLDVPAKKAETDESDPDEDISHLSHF